MNFLTDGPRKKFRWKSEEAGQITVFLSLILLAVILLAAVLADLSRISAGRALTKRAVNSAAKSVMAEYGSKLGREYGLFALAEKDSSVLADELKRYISDNLTIPEEDGDSGQRIDLFGFRVEKVEVTPVFNLGENAVFRQQVLEYMKYRAPKELVEGFLDRLAVFRETGRMSEAYKKKVGVDKILGRMDKSQQKLKKKVDGDGSSGGLFVNGFNAGGSWMEAFNRFSSLCSGLDSLRNRLGELDERIGQLRSFADGSGGAEGEDGQDGTADRLMRLLEQRSSMAESLDDMEEAFESGWNDIRYGLTGDYEAPNREAAAEVNKIAEAGKEASAALAELEAFMKEGFKDTDSLSGDFAAVTGEEIKRLKELILDGQKAGAMLSELGGNTDMLKALASRLDVIKRSIGGASGYTIPAALSNGIGGLLGGYANIDYDYEKPQKGEDVSDPRKGKKEEAERTLLDNLAEDRNYLTEGIEASELPSNNKLPSDDFKEEDAPYLGEAGEGAAKNAAARAEAAYEGDLVKVGENTELYDEEGVFQENALGFIGEIGKIASEDIKKLRDNIYIDEYIMGSFRNSVPALVSGSETVEDKDFRGILKSERETFYEGEVEYVLHGNASETANKLMTRAQILLVRFGLDTLHVYTDARKKQAATGIAAAVAGWWTGSAGIPVVANLVMCGWGMGEAALDVKELLEGRSVPVYKLSGDWKTDIGPGKSSGPKTDQRLHFSYYDYLRLFLLCMNEDKKLDRTEDLIQLNMGKSKDGFRMTGCKTAVRVEAVVSMKYLFLGRTFVPASMRTEDGRHKFSILLYEGY